MGGANSSTLTNHNSDANVQISKSGSGISTSDNNLGEIHSLYQELFLTDIKKEVELAQTELK